MFLPIKLFVSPHSAVVTFAYYNWKIIKTVRHNNSRPRKNMIFSPVRLAGQRTENIRVWFGLNFTVKDWWEIKLSSDSMVFETNLNYPKYARYSTYLDIFQGTNWKEFILSKISSSWTFVFFSLGCECLCIWARERVRAFNRI